MFLFDFFFRNKYIRNQSAMVDFFATKKNFYSKIDLITLNLKLFIIYVINYISLL